MEHKDKIISIIISNKEITSGHRLRIEFVEKIKNDFNTHVDVYGRGFNEIEDKWDAIAPYKYHIVLENSSFLDYWTEKLADCYLGGAYPIYYGCNNLEDYFSKGSFSMIDINDFEKSKNIIQDCINDNFYEKNMDLLKTCKDLILDKYNLFPMITNFINSGKIKSDSIKMNEIKLFPEDFNYIKFLKSTIRNFI